jgi:hypothetical protein
MFTATQKTTNPPRARTDSPEYVAALAKLNDLKHQLAATQAEIEAARVSRLDGDGMPKGGIEEQARALLAGGTATATEVSLETRLETIADLTQTSRVLREAIRIQDREVDAVRARVDRAITEAVLPEYRAILSDMAKVLAPVCALAAKEAAFRDRLQAEGVSLAILEPCPLNDLRLDVYASKVNRWLDDIAKAHGITVKMDRKVSP